MDEEGQIWRKSERRKVIAEKGKGEMRKKRVKETEWD